MLNAALQVVSRPVESALETCSLTSERAVSRVLLRPVLGSQLKLAAPAFLSTLPFDGENPTAAAASQWQRIQCLGSHTV